MFFFFKFKDPCSSYSLIFGQYQRSSNYTIKSTDIAFSDNFLSEGWYRFDSGAGNDMVTWAPSIYQCGTIYPIWMRGIHQNNFEVLNMKVHICTVYLHTVWVKMKKIIWYSIVLNDMTLSDLYFSMTTILKIWIDVKLN